MKHSVEPRSARLAQRPEAPGSDAIGNHLMLTLIDENARKERGYNPYDTISHTPAARKQDVWRNKPKRA